MSDPISARPTNLNPKVSAVIPVFNAQATMAACLNALRNSAYPLHEIVVVSDASTDRSAEIATELGAKVIALPTNHGAAYCRNLGVKSTESEIIVFVDSDVMVEPQTVGNIVKHLTQGDLAAVFGLYSALPPVPNVYSIFKNLQHHYVHLMNTGEVRSFWTGCSGIYREVFLKLGGFDPEIRFMEDVSFGYTLFTNGQRTRLVDDVIGQHLKVYTLGSLIRSDLFGRAVPWTRLILAGKAPSGTLNTTRKETICLALNGLIGLSVLPSVFNPLFLVAALSMEVILIGLNFQFLKYIYRLKGALFTLSAIALLHLYYINCSLGVLIALVETIFARGKAVPTNAK